MISARQLSTAVLLTIGLAVTLSACNSSTSPTSGLNSYETALVAHWRFAADSGGVSEAIDYTLNNNRSFTNAVSIHDTTGAFNETGTGVGTWTANATRIYATTNSVTGSTRVGLTVGADSVGYTLSGNTLTITPLDTVGVAFHMTRQ